jgi:RNA polymerase sigma-70 factor (ECF subfamily)
VQGNLRGLTLSPELPEVGERARVVTPLSTNPNRSDPRLREALDRNLSLVWRVLRRSGLGPADAEDASQDAFWVFAQRMQSVPVQAERSFLVSTALRIASACRRSKWHRSVVAFESDGGASDAPLPDEALDRRRAAESLEVALAALDDSERAVFILADLEQMSRSEVARTLELPEGTVASRLLRARAAVFASVRRQRSGLWRRP